MHTIINDAENVLADYVSGFHQYILDNPAHLKYVSRNLCDMLKVSEDELTDDGEDMYLKRVHPDDRDFYSDFIRRLSLGEMTLTLQYRLVAQDGKILYVSDTFTSKRLEDGILAGYSVLSDITALKEEYNSDIANNTTQNGFIRCTCEKQPRITYINDYMIDMMRFPESKDKDFDFLGMYRDNIYLMIPVEERRRFTLYLNRVYTNGTPFTGEMTLVRCDGTLARVFGWITKSVNDDGAEEFQAVFIDISERYQEKNSEISSYNDGGKDSENNYPLIGKSKVYIRTFGYFDVFVDDRPIAFSSRKAKELLALLVDRRGGFVTTEEAVAFLWEDEPSSPVVLSRCRKIAHRLKNILEGYGIADIVEVMDGKRRIVSERVQCDLYDYLSGKKEFANLFKGNYLTNYSWGETTLGELTCDDRFR